MTIENWCDLKQIMLDDLKAGGFGRMQSYTVNTAGGSRSVSYSTHEEWKKWWNFVCEECAKSESETGTAYYGRMYAGSRGK